jgi:hypothetical protein
LLARQIRFLNHGTAAWDSDRDVRSKITRKAGGSLSCLRDFSTADEDGVWKMSGCCGEEMSASVTTTILHLECCTKESQPRCRRSGKRCRSFPRMRRRSLGPRNDVTFVYVRLSSACMFNVQVRRYVFNRFAVLTDSLASTCTSNMAHLLVSIQALKLAIHLEADI